MDSDDYDRMFRAQRGRCAICRTQDPGRGNQFFCIDHDHKTNKVRGLLCWSCNMALGWFRDTPRVILAAWKYLTKKR